MSEGPTALLHRGDQGRQSAFNNVLDARPRRSRFLGSSAPANPVSNVQNQFEPARRDLVWYQKSVLQVCSAWPVLEDPVVSLLSPIALVVKDMFNTRGDR